MTTHIRLTIEDIGSFLEKMAEHSENVYWLSSPDFSKIIYISPAYEKVWQRSRDALYKEPELWISYLHPDDVENHHPIHEMREKVSRLGEAARYAEDYRIIQPNGGIRWIVDRGFPIVDEDGHCLGVTGVAVDITSEIEARQIRSEKVLTEKKLQEAQLQQEFQQQLLEAQEQFVNIADQVAHDIRSPLSSLLMIVKSCAEIPEQYRVALREAAISIGDIANHLLARYKKEDSEQPTENTEESKPLLVSTLLLEILAEKKYEYQGLPVKIHCDITEMAYFAFIRMQSSSFRRAISNLINNAVDAFEHKPGKITLKLTLDEEHLSVSVIDNGKGMPNLIKDKILKHIAVTSGKKAGHGIGLTQVQQTLTQHQGRLHIDSHEGKGTEMRLVFPLIAAPNWIAEEIRLNPNDCVIILDDDTSIHGAWKTKFISTLNLHPQLEMKHFHLAEEALKFIKNLSSQERQRVFLLTDFELLNQELNGLHVVAESGLQRSILVTSHYANAQLLKSAQKTHTKVLPKQLASEILIRINSKRSDEKTLKKVDAILVDDNKLFVNTLKTCIFKGLRVDDYQDPYHFLEQIHGYDKHTKIYLDSNFDNASIKGIELADKLHVLGFQNLYLLTGEQIKQDETPNYLSVIRKDDLNGIENTFK